MGLRTDTQPAPGKVGTAGLTASLKPIADEAFGFKEARHLLWRAGFGGTSEQVRVLAGWGPQRAVDHILNFDKVAADATLDQAFDANIMRPPTPEERRRAAEARRARDEEELAQLQKERQAREALDRAQLLTMQKWWLRRMIETGRPLEEKLTLFWHGHFATSYRGIEDSYHLAMQNQMFRANAAGNFRSLLRGIIRDPAMLAYLNNNQNRKEKPNENLAREIMELFSLGIGNYTEQDIKEGAKALTGYTYEDDEFTYNRRQHDEGSKRILGSYGNLDGDDFVDAILKKPECAAYITRRLYHFFVADVPNEERGGENNLSQPQREALRQLASTLRNANYEIKPMLRRLFLSEHFYQPRFLNEQIKSPTQLVVGAVRSLNTPVRDLGLLTDALKRMGQELFLPPSVKGWDGGRSWMNASTLFDRQNILTYLLTGRKTSGTDAADAYDPTPLLADLPAQDRTNTTKLASHLLDLCLGRSPATPMKEVEAFLAASKNPSSAEALTGALLLITALPEYQLC
jgi:uncharacterized protein (DUF1800 family)